MMRALATIAILLSAASAAAAPVRPAPPASALEAAVRDLCDRDVALLGEADHGDGRTVEFKVALVRLLIERCHYNAIFFESGHYEFAELSRRLRLGQATSPDMLAAAIGGLWRFDREMAPLPPFLLAEAQAGRVTLGGLDDQVGSLGAFYENEEMPAALAGHLAGAGRAECRELLSRRTHWADGVRAEPERSRTLTCLADIADAVRRRHDSDRATRFAHLGMVASFERLIARDRFISATPMDMNGYIRGRDQSLYLNFRYLADQLPPRSRIIVWAANAHIAKDASAPEYGGSENLGAFIHRAYGRRAFALGFSALAGTHFWTPQEPSRPFEAAAPGSLEAGAMARNDANIAYLGAGRLAALGVVPGSLYLHRPLAARWSAAMDAILVFREERAPRRIDNQ